MLTSRQVVGKWCVFSKQISLGQGEGCVEVEFLCCCRKTDWQEALEEPSDGKQTPRESPIAWNPEQAPGDTSAVGSLPAYRTASTIPAPPHCVPLGLCLVGLDWACFGLHLLCWPCLATPGRQSRQSEPSPASILGRKTPAGQDWVPVDPVGTSQAKLAARRFC